MNAQHQTLRVLLVEDSPADARAVREELRDATREQQPELTHVQTLAAALAQLKTGVYDCVLLDLGLPDGGGVALVEAVRAANRDIAIVILTGLDDERSALEALRRGAQEYAVKGQHNGDALLRILRHAFERHRLMCELDRQREREYFLATHDSLTGLANRQLLMDRAQQALTHAQRQGGQVALCFIDLDGFKPVNDRYGHAAGDALLCKITRVLLTTVRDGDTIARIGGDEFVALLTSVRSQAEAQLVVDRMIEGISSPMQIEGREITIGASIGLSMYPQHGLMLDALMAKADAAMYQTKRAHKNGSGRQPMRAAA